MDRVRRISMEILARYRNLFTDDFEKNKLILSKVAIINSKQLRNELAGYITSVIRREKAEAEKS
ncbi:MAG: 30S ribosomal protein S17e [Nitrososphaerota archaeon]|nr:hypothetical protein [Nitrososphaerales archaeon]MCX8192014.1 hypothetical protein [Nitrososphaerales archaeon]MDW8045197.1 30S ribosomal protein S17e [Nitrososphaerota archaeon]